MSTESLISESECEKSAETESLVSSAGFAGVEVEPSTGIRSSTRPREEACRCLLKVKIKERIRNAAGALAATWLELCVGESYW